ncbi:MAG: heme o synthase [Halodesulfurarchaeum sp.]
MVQVPRTVVDVLERRFTGLLAVSAIGVYVLVLVGTTTSLFDAGSSCSGWPTCNGGLLPGGEPMAILAWGHRLVGLLVGLVLIATVVASWYHGSKRVKMAVIGAALLYPIQTVLGAVLALQGGSSALSIVHLLIAMTIFSGVLIGLLWRLEEETVEPTTTPSTPTVHTPDPVPPDRPYSTNREPSTKTVLWAYFSLTKPRLWWLLSLVAVAAMALAAGPSLSMGTVVATITGGVLAIASSGTFNQVLERERDAAMDRTNDRPLVDGTISPRSATLFGFVLAAVSTLIFLRYVNALAAGLGLLAILFYSVVYTLVLKPRTDQNVVIGGAVGAFPALIGWAAVTDTIGVPAIVLGAVIFLWTPAHFYNLAILYKEDYANAGVPMLSVSRGDALTRRHILLYLGATMTAVVALGFVRQLSWGYVLAAVGFGSIFLWTALRLFEERSDRAAWRNFHASNAYLGVLLLAIVVDSMVFA